MESRPKALFLLHLPPPVHGSSVVGMNILNSILINNTFDVDHINLLASRNITESGKVGFRKVISFVRVFCKVITSVITQRPKFCYLALTSTGAAFYKDLILVAFLKLFGVPRIYHMHNKGVSDNQGTMSNRLCYRFLFHRSDVILLSKHLYPDIKDFVHKSNVYICPNGIADEVKHHKQLVKAINTSWHAIDNLAPCEQVVKILFLSNLLRAKGVYTLLEACAILKQKHIQFDCTFIGGEGDISDVDFQATLDQLHLTSQVTYQGKRFGEEKFRAFSEADIFVFPTYFETFGLVNLEAMQHSLPIVSTFEGGIPDIVDNNVTGFLVPPKNAEALASKLELLISNPDLRRRMGIAGRKRYEEEFTFSRFERKLTSILLAVSADSKNYNRKQETTASSAHKTFFGRVA